ncbi:MAG: dihydroneopterin aldolase [SAR202 cluster bacterium]|jgi:dihydroneopterin aldolase|nr:dihydroneopterin aldolase [SAR202 cluster bacterium]MDP6663318.1 dihydroneopterin aldolase [SAR202 cluster bacterium]MDP6800980.1 dihydroneopterin aldolase [SAR202 cluster bacterium]|tara:strand:- start:1815 stop:2192 length:378 start_codon:yes stop_codon:yes gene_type:complete
MNEDMIVLAGMVFYGFHGVDSDEQALGQRFIVDLEVHMDLEPAGRSDDIRHTVNYSRLFGTVREVVEGKSVKLLGTLADRIATEILDRFPAQATRVRVKKPDPPIKGSILDYAGVEVYRRRSGSA